MRFRGLTSAAAALIMIFLLVDPAKATTEAANVLVANGTVTDSSGHALPGVTVDLYAWPSDHVLQGLKHGQQVPRTLIATTTTSTSGGYSLSVSSGLLHSVAVSGGYANLEVDADDAAWFFTSKVSDPSVASTHLTAANPDPCTGWIYQRQLPNSWSIIGQAYILPNATKVQVSFAYTAGQSSTLGVGISGSDKVGSFTGDGTVSTSSTGVAGFPTLGPGNVLYRTLFRVGLYLDECSGGRHVAEGGTRWLVRSNGWFGGENLLHPAKAPNATQCAPYLSGGYFKTQNERAVTWSAGFTVTVVGFNAQAQTGYDSSAQLNYNFWQNGLACGTNAGPYQAAQVVAKALSYLPCDGTLCCWG